MKYSKYEKQGFVGVDVSLEISLAEYGLIWKEFKYNLKKRGVVKGEILAICWSPNPDTEPTKNSIDYGYFKKDELLAESWVEWESIAECNGMTVKELQEQDAGNLLYTLISYYGPQEFGF